MESKGWGGEERDREGIREEILAKTRCLSFLNFSFLISKAVNNKAHVLPLFGWLNGMISITCFPQCLARNKLLLIESNIIVSDDRFLFVMSIPSTHYVLDSILRFSLFISISTFSASLWGKQSPWFFISGQRASHKNTHRLFLKKQNKTKQEVRERKKEGGIQ